MKNLKPGDCCFFSRKDEKYSQMLYQTAFGCSIKVILQGEDKQRLFMVIGVLKKADHLHDAFIISGHLSGWVYVADLRKV